MKEFIGWLKTGWEIICELIPWLLQGSGYLVLAAMYFIILFAAYVFIFRKDETVENMKKTRANAEFIIIAVISIALAIFTLEMYVRTK